MTTDILCIEVDACTVTGRPPMADEGPLSLLSRTGRWAFMRSEALDRIKMDEPTKAAIREVRKVLLPPNAFTDFFGPDTEVDDGQDKHVRIP